MARERKSQTTLWFPADLLAAVRADLFGDSLSVTIERHLRRSLKLGPAPRSKFTSPLEAAELSKKESEAAIAKRKLEILSHDYVRRDMAFELVGRDHAIIRSRINAIPASITGLTPEQFEDVTKAAQDCLTDLSAGRQDTWNDLADEAANDFA